MWVVTKGLTLNGWHLNSEGAEMLKVINGLHLEWRTVKGDGGTSSVKKSNDM